MAGSENSSSKAPGLAERPLSGNRDGRFGSRHDRHAVEFIARKLPVKFRRLKAAHRH